LQDSGTVSSLKAKGKRLEGKKTCCIDLRGPVYTGGKENLDAEMKDESQNQTEKGGGLVYSREGRTLNWGTPKRVPRDSVYEATFRSGRFMPDTTRRGKGTQGRGGSGRKGVRNFQIRI